MSPSPRCQCGRRLIHLDEQGQPLAEPVCVYSQSTACTAPSLEDE